MTSRVHALSCHGQNACLDYNFAPRHSFPPHANAQAPSFPAHPNALALSSPLSTQANVLACALLALTRTCHRPGALLADSAASCRRGQVAAGANGDASPKFLCYFGDANSEPSTQGPTCRDAALHVAGYFSGRRVCSLSRLSICM